MSSVKAIFRYANEDNKKLFKESKCLLLISVGQESHEGERFSKTIDLINSSFESCIILLYDSLQRYTMALNSAQSPEYYHKIATDEGYHWLERNKKFYNKLSNLQEVYHWDHWLNQSDFVTKKAELQEIIKVDSTYKAVFDNSINKYLERYCKRITSLDGFDIERAKKICFDYILEECVVLCLWTKLNCHYEVYPNHHNDAIEETRQRFITPHYPELLNSVTIRFRNAKQIKPQCFELLEKEFQENQLLLTE